MARITVEDCLQHVENRFDLVLKAAKRAHDLEMGSVDPLVPVDNDKPTVIALREIAQGLLLEKNEEIEQDQKDIADSYFSPSAAEQSSELLENHADLAAYTQQEHVDGASVPASEISGHESVPFSAASEVSDEAAQPNDSSDEQSTAESQEDKS